MSEVAKIDRAERGRLVIRRAMAKIGIASLMLAVVAIGGPGVGPAPSAQAQPRQRAAPRYTIDTTLRDLVANPQARAVVNKYAPGIDSGPHYWLAAGYSLKQLNARMSGMITAAELKQMSQELARIR